ncbi:RsbT co-antagonist protein RsbRA [Alkalihalobacillus hemicellulosilyticus]|uniref:Positive regulator of sigma-B n=1 Tax=Halalkalibacter hemicellulosilyticusJCM 9152 TaxID=1236971 RepID=W4QB55_9BACI|nr:RsbT co-antagonist protein RsbRA [Halalkalibacter hemicellulosilyticus]GAE28898.1 positive regulator of sigma-B [Halalkalibacter hemicellulosilyticusJCM 9152]
MQPYLVSFVSRNREEILEKWDEQLKGIREENYLDSISDSVYENTNQTFMNYIVSMANLGSAEAKVKISDFADEYIQSGWPLAYFTQGLQAFRRVIVDVYSSSSANIKEFMEVFHDLEEWTSGIINQLVSDYTGSWETIFEMQKLSLLELSAPLIPVFEGVTVMPLIGTIDTARAKLIMENLLEGVIEHRSQVVLIDITGVPVVDTMVAHHVIQASEAVRLVGSTCILVGIRPEIAQTIVNLGIDLSEFPTKSTLKKGIETAFEFVNKKVVDL